MHLLGPRGAPWLTAIVAGSVWSSAGCGGGDEHGSAASVRPATTSAAPSPSQSAASAGSAEATAEAKVGAGEKGPAVSPLAGNWKGSYRSEKVSPTLDPTVKDDVWKDDDGKQHVGSGKIELTVAPDGTTTGTIEGALGPAELHGIFDEPMVRAQVGAPGSPGPSGTLVGRREKDGLAVEIRTSDGSGKLPRIARGRLDKVRP